MKHQKYLENIYTYGTLNYIFSVATNDQMISHRKCSMNGYGGDSSNARD